MRTNKITGLFRLFRLELPLAAGICGITGQILALGVLPDFRVGILGFACIFCLSSAALIFNDFFDYDVDKINAPHRPLPSGLVSFADVIRLGVIVTLAGFIAALALSFSVFLVSVIFWLVGFLYNRHYKQRGLLGNLMVSLSVAGTFIFGAFTVQDPWNGIVWIFSFMAFFLDLGEEIAGDAMDMEGDKKRESQSIAIRKGKPFAVRVSVALWGVTVLLSFLPVILGFRGLNYLIAILIIDAIIFYFSIKLLQSHNPEQGHKAMRGTYLGGTLGIIAFLIGQILG